MMLSPKLSAKILPFIFISTLLISTLLVSTTKVQAKTLNLAIDIWPPYTGKSLPHKGMATWIVTTILHRAGYQTQLAHEKWNRVVQGVDLGVYDVVVTMWENKIRQRRFIFSDPYFQNKIVFYRLKGSAIEFNSLKDLSGLMVGTIDGYAYNEAFQNDDKIIKVAANRLTQNFLAMMSGKLDLVVADQFLAEYELLRYLGSHAKKFEVLAKPLDIRALRIAVSKKNKNARQIIEAFNRSLRNMQASGEIERMIARYQQEMQKLKTQ